MKKFFLFLFLIPQRRWQVLHHRYSFWRHAVGGRWIAIWSTLSILLCTSGFAQNPGEWVWLHGDSITNNPGNFGTQGVSSPTNYPPSLYESCEWTDLNGNFWLFGGCHINASYGDVWKFDPLINQWTWMKGSGIPNGAAHYGTQGIPSPLNNPPVAWGGINSWVDSDGNFWMFGGGNNVAYSDLWKYNVTSNEWTWMKGPGVGNQFGVYGTRGISNFTNNPGSRGETSASWVDNAGDFWMFGGHDHLGDYLNDLWRYNIASNTWTWMKGSQYPNYSGVFGIKGVEDTASTPDARWAYCRWKDSSGNLWLFGGKGPSIAYNDMWRFNPSTNNWTWMSGNSVGNTNGVNGIKCIADSANNPHYAIESRATWIDANDNFWAYVSGRGIYNSLWMYCSSTNQWAMIKADSLLYNAAPSWGIKGVSSPSTMPMGLMGSIGWTDRNGHLYMFGGWWGGGIWSNALWMYTIDPCCSACNTSISVENFSATDTTLCPGTCLNIINNSQSYSGYQWYFTGGNPYTSNLTNPQNICYPTSGIYDITLIASGCNRIDTLTFLNYINVYSQPPAQSITQNGDTLFAIAGTGTYQWYFNNNLINGATDYFYVAQASGDFNVVATDVNGCEVEAAIFNVTAGLTLTLSKGEGINLYPNPVTDKMTIHYSQATKGTAPQGVLRTVEISIYNMLGENIQCAFDRQLLTVDCRLLPSGMYWLEVSSSEKTYRTKFIKQ